MAEAGSSGAGSEKDSAGAGPRASADAPAPRTLSAIFAEAGVVQRAVCSAFAWVVTVAPAAFSRAGGALAQALALACLAAGIAGPALVPSRKRLGRQLGITLFLALATLTWLLASSALEPGRLDPVRAGIGAIAWGVYAFSWGEPWRFRTEAPQDDAGGVLRARSTLPAGAVPITGAGVVAGLALLVIGWSVRDPSRALLAQAASIGLSVAVVGAFAQVAIARSKGRRPTATALPREALRAIIGLLLVALAGAAVLILRR